ncbi:hypothetical protein [Virgibacillus dakarensis]|uniref:hypothetical protein n=1 Tax=Virgibacillus dakarensis TaxID=1917889 RepID=UPI000B44BCED|nr:hypothetical protein [Virgibacillus dakarensis]
MSSKNRSRWYLSIVGLGAFVVGTILTLIFDLNIYTMLGFLTAAIILVIANVVYVFYTKTKSTEKKNKAFVDQ